MPLRKQLRKGLHEVYYGAFLQRADVVVNAGDELKHKTLDLFHQEPVAELGDLVQAVQNHDAHAHVDVCKVDLAVILEELDQGELSIGRPVRYHCI